VGSLITLVESSSTQLLNSPVTFTATVSSPTPSPTGTVTFMDGSTVLGSAPLSTNGVTVSFDLTGNAAWATTTLAMGSHTITAVYSGDGSFAASTSAPVTNIVQDFTNKNSGSASQNVFPGHTTTFNFTLAPVGATTFMSNVDLAVTGLPEGTTYTFQPTTVAAGAGSTSVTLTVTTSSSLQAQNNGPSRSNTLPVAFAALGLCGLGFVRRYRRQMPRLLAVLLLLAGTLLPVAGLTGCAGGYFALTPKNYTVTVTGTEGTIQHSATATLVVQ
jgi:hypothetical protein